jgi:hypothetical protein
VAKDHTISVPVYGPFCRLEATPGQDAATAVRQILSGEVWGRVPRNRLWPTVQAYGRPLRPGESGIEFWSFQPPDGHFGPRPQWHRPGAHLWIETVDGREVAMMRVAFTRITQDLLHDLLTT